jgi:hypothetical protein
MERNVILVLAFALSLGTAAAQEGFKTAPTGSTPVPDPTLLTTQASEKAVAGLKELLAARIEALEKAAATLNAALALQEQRTVSRLDQVPAAIDSRLTIFKQLMDEKFKGVDQQFAGRDVALAAALLAQKTSVDEQNKANAASSAKSENATTKQIDGITSIITASQKANDDKIDAVKGLLVSQKQGVDSSIADLKDRIAASDARLSAFVASVASRTEGSVSVVQYIVLAGTFLFGLIGAVGMVVAMTRRHGFSLGA